MKEITSTDNIHFPGRWVGSISLLLGPLLMLIGVALRYRFDFFFPHQLAAYHDHPTLIAASYSTCIAGTILMWPAVLTLVQLISGHNPKLAFWGGILTIFGLFARTFHAGVDHLAFQLVQVQNVELATKIIDETYGAFHIFRTFNLAIMLGWIILAIGAYRSRTLNLTFSIALGLMSGLPLGVLKGTSPFSFVATIGLCIALVPLGFKVLRDGPTPSIRTIFSWSIGTLVLIIGFYLIGQAG
ncbi:hypothetical protein [Shimazuella kribbensis]|uniref:hypothetical protein n=1 Tax=Shimazuella kribbensis TaxID=139808 RepID=UPI000410B93E|nr:hypothetical protein [Shimazuella kribbensis]